MSKVFYFVLISKEKKKKGNLFGKLISGPERLFVFEDALPSSRFVDTSHVTVDLRGGA